MAERVGFEPTCRLRDNTLSRRARYDHFGTSPQRGSGLTGSHIGRHISNFGAAKATPYVIRSGSITRSTALPLTRLT